MRTIRSKNGVVTIYLYETGDDLDFSISLHLPGYGDLPARKEGFQFMLDKEAALALAENIQEEFGRPRQAIRHDEIQKQSHHFRCAT